MESNLINWINNNNNSDTIVGIILTISNNDIFITKQSLLDFIKSNSKFYKGKGLNDDQFKFLKLEILKSIKTDNYFNQNDNDTIIYNINDNIKNQSIFQHIIENNLLLNQNQFIKTRVSTNSSNNKNDDNEEVVVINLNKYTDNKGKQSLQQQQQQQQSQKQDSFGENIEMPAQKQKQETQQPSINNNEMLIIELIPNKNNQYFFKEIPFEISNVMTQNEYSNFITKINRAYSGFFIKFCFFISYIINALALILFFNYVLIYIIFPIMVSIGIFLIVYLNCLRYKHLHWITGRYNRKLIKNSVPLEFHIVYKDSKFKRTNDNMTMIIHFFPNQTINKINDIDV